MASAALGGSAATSRSPRLALPADDLLVDAHTMVDFGDDALTQGRAHPMIDPTLRLEQLARAAADPGTGVHPDGPGAGPRRRARPVGPAGPGDRGGPGRAAVPVIVSLVGTDLDPQGLTAQRDALVAAGAEVHLSNASATRRAIDLLSHSEDAA